MKYHLVSKNSTARSGYVQFERHGSGLNSFLCELDLTVNEIEELLKRIREDTIFESSKGLDFVDRFCAKYLHGAQEIIYIGQIGEGKKTGYIQFYQCMNRKKQRFFFLRTRNSNPYGEESGGFNCNSVLDALENARKLTRGRSAERGQ